MQTNTAKLTPKDYLFLTFAFILCFGIGVFSFWLGFPGYILDYDTFNVLDFILHFGAPMNTLFIWLITLIFGKHTFYLFLLNNIMLYLGIFFLIAGFYLRYKSIFALAPLFIVLLGNVYLSNFVAMNYILMANFIFCAYSIIFMILMGGGNRKKLKITLWILIFILLFLGLLWRHNAIFSAFPAFFIIAYIFCKDCANFAKKFIAFIAISALICLTLALEITRIVPKPYESHPSNHLLLLQIAGACVPANDASCFDDEWYYFDGKASNMGTEFERVKRAYNNNPLNGDLYICGNSIFECGELKGLKSALIRAITKYPSNFLAHESRFFKAMWWQNPRDDDEWGHAKSLIKSPDTIQEIPRDSFRLDILQKWGYPQSEWHIAFSPLQEKIYTILYNHLPVLNHAIFVALGFALLIFSAFGIFRARKYKSDKSLLIFAFATALTACASAFIIAAMAIVPHSRYMSPVAIFSIIALVGFVGVILECRAQKEWK